MQSKQVCGRYCVVFHAEGKDICNSPANPAPSRGLWHSKENRFQRKASPILRKQKRRFAHRRAAGYLRGTAPSSDGLKRITNGSVSRIHRKLLKSTNSCFNFMLRNLYFIVLVFTHSGMRTLRVQRILSLWNGRCFSERMDRYAQGCFCRTQNAFPGF